MRKYTFSALEIRQSGYQSIDLNCNGITFINQGNGYVIVNECLLNASPLNTTLADRFAGESLAVGGNEGEVYTGQIKITFEPGITNPLVIVVQKYYLQS